jgi:drug/metabolite transporter (DMT)-like permease
VIQTPAPAGRPTEHLAAVHLAVFLFGAAGLFGKLVHLPATLIVLGRVGFAAPALYLLLFASGVSVSLKNRIDILGLAATGGLMALHWVAFFRAIQVSTVAVGTLTFSTFPVFTAFLEPLVFRERFRIADAALSVIAFCGVALVIPIYDFANDIFRGALWGVLAGFTFALLSVANRKFVRRYPGRLVAFYQMVTAAGVLFPFLFVETAALRIGDLFRLILLGVVFTAVAHSLFIGGMRRVNAHTASVIACLEPVYGILLAALLLGETPTPRILFGGAVILVASAAATFRRI